MSSGAMNTPCARGKSPSPNERRKLPSRSNTIIGCSPRLKTKTLSFLSTPTPPISLNDQPGGSFAQFPTGSYEYAPLPTIAMPRLPCSLPVGKLVTKQKVRPGTRRDTGVESPFLARSVSAVSWTSRSRPVPFPRDRPASPRTCCRRSTSLHYQWEAMREIVAGTAVQLDALVLLASQ